MIRSRRVPFVHQLSASDCGAACLTMVLAYHGHRRDLASVSAAMGAGTDGARLITIAEVGERHGLYAKAVRLDCHKMTAFVRFREVHQVEADEPRWIAWYEPSHRIVARTAPFFVDRFATMTWTIVTPDGIAHWDRVALTLLPYDPSIPRPAYDAKEALWLTYYESIFNPARLNVRAMQKEMPQKEQP